MSRIRYSLKIIEFNHSIGDGVAPTSLRLAKLCKRQSPICKINCNQFSFSFRFSASVSLERDCCGRFDCCHRAKSFGQWFVDRHSLTHALNQFEYRKVAQKSKLIHAKRVCGAFWCDLMKPRSVSVPSMRVESVTVYYNSLQEMNNKMKW